MWGVDHPEHVKPDVGGRDTVPVTFILDTQGIVRYIQREYRKGLCDILGWEAASLRCPKVRPPGGRNLREVTVESAYDRT